MICRGEILHSAQDAALAIRSGADACLMKTGDPGLFLKEVVKRTHHTRAVPMNSERMNG
jgi:hypothetical protein